jgi:DNA-binding NtrC family response regulator
VIKFRKTNSTLLVLGESGTGKEMVAAAVHVDTSLPFLAVNCAAYNGSADLMEAELFGVEKGSFTGATANKKGIFEAVGRGTVFLDEVHRLSLKAQEKLLRVLQEKKVRPVGSTREYPVSFRLMAAAKPDLEALVKRGDFIQDLYFRLNVLQIDIPALRDRTEDIAPLVSHFLRVYTPEGQKPKQFLVRTLRYFERYPWPGNVRELEHTIERLCVTVNGKVITPEDLDAKFYDEKVPLVYQREPRDLSRDVVIAAIQSASTIRDAADRLGIPKSTLHDLAKRFGIQKARRRVQLI